MSIYFWITKVYLIQHKCLKIYLRDVLEISIFRISIIYISTLLRCMEWYNSYSKNLFVHNIVASLLSITLTTDRKCHFLNAILFYRNFGRVFLRYWRHESGLSLTKSTRSRIHSFNDLYFHPRRSMSSLWHSSSRRPILQRHFDTAFPHETRIFRTGSRRGEKKC